MVDGCARAWKERDCANRLTIRAKVAEPRLLAGLQAALVQPATVAHLTRALSHRLNGVMVEQPKVRSARYWKELVWPGR